MTAPAALPIDPAALLFPELGGTDLAALAEDIGLTAEQWATVRAAIVALLDGTERVGRLNMHRSQGKTAKAWRSVRDLLRNMPPAGERTR